MDTANKSILIEQLIDNLKRDVLKRVDRMPEEWDGHELRKFIADYFSMHYAFTDLGRKRLKEYKNTCLVNNLY